MSVAGGMTLEDDTIVLVEPTTLGFYDQTFRFDAESAVGMQAQAVIPTNCAAPCKLWQKVITTTMPLSIGHI